MRLRRGGHWISPESLVALNQPLSANFPDARLPTRRRGAYRMHMAINRLWTVDEVRALPDDGMRYEVVDGQLLVTPAPSWTHGEAVQELQYRLHAWLRKVG